MFEGKFLLLEESHGLFGETLAHVTMHDTWHLAKLSKFANGFEAVSKDLVVTAVVVIFTCPNDSWRILLEDVV